MFIRENRNRTYKTIGLKKMATYIKKNLVQTKQIEDRWDQKKTTTSISDIREKGERGTCSSMSN